LKRRNICTKERLVRLLMYSKVRFIKNYVLNCMNDEGCRIGFECD
jgi:hypothetical protein